MRGGKVNLSTLVMLLIVLIGANNARAQKVLSVDLDQVKKITSAITSNYYYPTLLNRFNDFDTTLTAKEMHLIYYGKYFQPFYEPGGMAQDREKMYELIKQKDFNAALIYGKKSFDTDPIDLKTLFGISLCYHYMGEEEKMNDYLFLYYALVGTILESGSGKNIDEAFVIMNISDEYEIVSSIDKHVKKQKLIKGETDCLKLKKSKDRALNRIKKLYFNIKIPILKAEE